MSLFLERRCFFLEEDVDVGDCKVVFWIGVLDDDLGQELVNEAGTKVLCLPTLDPPCLRN